MIKFFKLLLITLLVTLPSFAEDVQAPINPNIRHVIQIPKGGLSDFLAWRHGRVALISHHRGGPMLGYPENAIETMDNALKYGPGLMEVDVAQLADGTLILMHDKTTNRTTTGEGIVGNLGWNDVKDLYLKDENGTVTTFKIPRLEDVLLWAKGRTLLTLDIKSGTDFRAVSRLVKSAEAEDYTIAIAYTVAQAQKIHSMAPYMPITVTMRNDEEIQAVEASGIPKHLIVAWTGTRVLPTAHYDVLHGKGWRVIMGTLGRGRQAIDKQIAANDNDARYLDIYRRGVDIIATDRFWAVQKQIVNPNMYFFIQKSIVVGGAH